MTKKNEANFDHFAEFGKDMSGYEGITLETMSIPFIKIVQDISPQLKKSKPEFIPEAEAGMLFNSVSEKLYSPPLKIVVGKFERYYIEWKANRGPFVAAHTPEEVENKMMMSLARDENYRLYDPKTGNTFADTYIYYILMPENVEEGVCILSMTSSGIKEAKKFNRNLMSTMIPGTTKRALPYFMVWGLEVVEMSNDKGSWYGYKIKFDSFVTQPQLTYVVEERKALPNKTVDLALLEEASGKNSNNPSDDEDVKY
jgi:hypothetical protein